MIGSDCFWVRFRFSIMLIIVTVGVSDDCMFGAQSCGVLNYNNKCVTLFWSLYHGVQF
jgi:hypothetical protein